MNSIMKIKLITYILIFFIPSISFAEYPNTSIGVIDINKILAESDAAVMASKQIEEIAIEVENEIKNSDEEIIKEQNLLIESQAIMAPEAFESKRIEYENELADSQFEPKKEKNGRTQKVNNNGEVQLKLMQKNYLKVFYNLFQVVEEKLFHL